MIWNIISFRGIWKIRVSRSFRACTSEGASACSLKRGEALLLPANLDEAVITPSNGRATLIEAHIREISEKDNYIREGVPAEPEEETTTGNGRYKS